MDREHTGGRRGERRRHARGVVIVAVVVEVPLVGNDAAVGVVRSSGIECDISPFNAHVGLTRVCDGCRYELDIVDVHVRSDEPTIIESELNGIHCSTVDGGVKRNRCALVPAR